MNIRSNGRITKWSNTPNKGDSDELVRVKLIAYKKWSHMITRVTSDKYQEKMPTYKLCSVCDEWLNYDNFYEDFIKIPFHWEKSYQFDKDILFKGNKSYEYGKCAMIPSSLNSLLYNPKAYNRDLPHGVTRYAYDNSYFVATVYKHGKNHMVCRSKSLEEAFNAYKVNKEAYIKEVTSQYEGLVSEDVYNALMNWEICFDD